MYTPHTHTHTRHTFDLNSSNDSAVRNYLNIFQEIHTHTFPSILLIMTLSNSISYEIICTDNAFVRCSEFQLGTKLFKRDYKDVVKFN